jgi:diguanylate cyclase (GGDEF)-like protein
VRRQLRPLQELREAARRMARRDFSKPLRIAAGDEFGELAKSFNDLSDRLRSQFLALESLSAVDRLLLEAPDMEQILDTLMPRMAAVLDCEALCVLLVDAESPGQSRIYDFQRLQLQLPPVRRVGSDLAELRHDWASQPVLVIGAAVAKRSAVLAPLHEGGAVHFEVRALQHEGAVHGYLCLGWSRPPEQGDSKGVGAGDFADRLSLVLASLEKSQRLVQRANYDPLTNLPNRRMFIDQADAFVARAVAARRQCAFLYVDLDRFKRINDTSGHWIGDELLRCVAGRLTACVGENAVASRLAGDEFVVLLPELADAGAAMQVAERIIARLQQPIVVGKRSLQVGASVGIALAPADGRNAEELLRNADIAMYRAKESGRGRAIFFESDMQRRVQERLSIESGIHRAMRQEDFQLHYQPIVSTQQRGAVAVEALLRWPSGPRQGLNMPSVFIPVAEDSGLIVGLGEWVLRTACRQLRQWRTDEVPVDHVSVNVSARQLGEAGFLATTLRVLQDCGLQPQELQLEITEGVLAEGEAIAGVLREATAVGIRLALDDFGTGYSSLSYLRQYPIRTLKIDRSFVTGVPGEPEACRLVESILAMATALGRDVVAEGVETEGQRKFLEASGCTGFQGYLFGRPMEAVDIPGFTRRVLAMHRDAGQTTVGTSTNWSTIATMRMQRFNPR